MALKTFQEFDKGLSPKYIKQTSMLVIDSDENYLDDKSSLDRAGLNCSSNLVRISNQELVKETYSNASILFLPCKRQMPAMLKEALSFGLPIVAFENESNEEFIDQTCGYLLEDEMESKSIVGFANFFKMLLYDPYARTILKKGAKQKYDEQFSWGRLRARG